MTRSMTGFGKASRSLDGEMVTVELSAVNHRYLDAVVSLPPSWLALEPAIKEQVRKQVARGKVRVLVARKRTGAARDSVRCDEDLARQYVEASRKLGHLLGALEPLSLDTLVQLEGVVFQEAPEEDLDAAHDVVAAALDEALGALNGMRDTEGAALAEELTLRVSLMREALATVEQRLPEVEQAYAARLRTRIDELGADANVTEERLAVELALAAEKGDVTEETVRFKTHLDHVFELLDGPEPAGRALNFLVQEIQREINTLGSKVRDTEVTREVLRMKAELEKFREQVQNIE